MLEQLVKIVKILEELKYLFSSLGLFLKVILIELAHTIVQFPNPLSHILLISNLPNYIVVLHLSKKEVICCMLIY